MAQTTVTPTEYAVILIDKYEKFIKNMEWHLATNASYLLQGEKECTRKRIGDFKDIIYDLKKFTL